MAATAGVVELIMFLDVCRLYLETTRPRRSQGLCVLWAIVTFVRTEPGAADFVRWCQSYRVPRLRERRDRRPGSRATSDATSDHADPRFFFFFGRRLHGIERKILRVLQDFFYCGACLPTGDLI